MPGIWDRYRDVIIDRDWYEDVDQAVTCPKDEDLDRFEQRTGLSLPVSYRQFALTFGLGSLMVSVGERYDGRCEYKVPEFDCGGEPKQASYFLRFHPSTAATPLVDRLIFFASDGGGNTLWGWDPHHVTDAERHEYAIYQAGDGKAEGVRATSFESFVLDFIFRGGLPPERLPAGTGFIDEDLLNEINPCDDEVNRHYAFWPERIRDQN